MLKPTRAIIAAAALTVVTPVTAQDITCNTYGNRTTCTALPSYNQPVRIQPPLDLLGMQGGLGNLPTAANAQALGMQQQQQAAQTEALRAQTEFYRQQTQMLQQQAREQQAQQLSQQQSEWCKAHPDRTLFCPKQ